jgi:hypothetical protein
MTKIIAFVGVAGAGKTTAASYVVKIGPPLTPRVEMRRYNFATPIKDMTIALLKACGVVEKDARQMVLNPDLKGVPVPQVGGFTPRTLMQTIGTEWGREVMHEDFWITLALHRINTAIKKGYGVVYDDLRFENEANMVRALGGAVVGIRGRQATLDPTSAAHASENQHPEPDFWIENDGPEEKLHAAVDAVIAKYLQDRT